MKHNLNLNDFDLDEIESIELIGDMETVDIEVEDTHMFYANDVYSHNSGADDDVIEGDKMAGAYAKLFPVDFAMSLSRKTQDKLSNTARLNIIKSRFGPDGIVFPVYMDTEIGKIDIYESVSDKGKELSANMKTDQQFNKQQLQKKYTAYKEVKESKSLF